MPRIKPGVQTRQRHKKVLKLAKGYFGSKSRTFRRAQEQMLKSQAYAYRDRRNRKRDFRKLWIARINAAARNNGTTYSQLMHCIKESGININRKMLADMAINDAQGFSQLVEQVCENK
ncbi:MAG: 50S ribosomal protein L20 [Bacillota bacterium]|jgi:large subunit ribosomal protein L20|nr:50S ribosomal protein L20 [Bacillota bacterium]HOC05997.1 50S ribosomal protein L20 [Bacillota bacterium]HPZ22050.1 50S ribosomal protein L20 [Bacillota bacterium]HQD20015.1 50S ribosomal protein L20 [Bacillota bacterium]